MFEPLRRPRRARYGAKLAWTLLCLSVALTLGALLLLILMLDDELPPDLRLGPIDAIGQIVLLAFPVIGALIASRRPENRIGWLFCIIGTAWAVYIFSDAYTLYTTLAHPNLLPGGTFTAWLTSWLSVFLIYSTATFLLLLFPSGHLLSPRWRPVAGLAIAGIAALIAFYAFTPGPLSDYDFIQNPIGIMLLKDVLRVAGTVASLLLPLAVLASAVSTVLRFRRSHGEERQQLKWFAFVAAFVGIAFVVVIALQNLTSLASIWLGVIAVGALTAIPIATGIAILRYRLYDIDLIINRTLVYSVLSGILALSYWVSIILLQQLFPSATRGSQLSVVASTLLVAAMFQPARRRIQSLVDRRFYRRKYDAARTIDAFSSRLRSDIELAALVDELRTVVDETMQPAHVSLWLKGLPVQQRTADERATSSR